MELPLDARIEELRRDIRTDKLDMTFGEFASMYERKELVINPAYQRLFRWEKIHRTRFIESLLLGIPTPAIFVAETKEGIWELIDGLQRISTVLEFFGVLRTPEGEPKKGSRLREIDNATIPGLGGLTFKAMSLRSRLSLQRAGCRVEVVKVGSSPRMKYDLFERLNTGGARLSAQEIRNCVFREQAPELMDYVDELAEYAPFRDSLRLSEKKLKAKYDRGLVLRFFALKNDFASFRHDVEPFISDYVQKIVDRIVPFDLAEEEACFRETMDLIWEARKSQSWRHGRDSRNGSQFSVYVFEALALGACSDLAYVRSLKPDERTRRFQLVLEDPEFLEAIGPGGNTRAKLESRTQAARRVLRAGIAGGTGSSVGAPQAGMAGQSSGEEPLAEFDDDI